MKGFIIGSFSSAFGQSVGAGVHGLFDATANQLITGGVSGFASSFSASATNALMTGDNPLISGIIGGVIGGLEEINRGNTFWGGNSSSSSLNSVNAFSNNQSYSKIRYKIMNVVSS